MTSPPPPGPAAATRVWLIVSAMLAVSACGSRAADDGEVAAANIQLGDDGAVVGVTQRLGPPSGHAIATLRRADGKDVGTVTASAARGGVGFTVDGRMLSPGPHGVDLYEIGRCDAPGFARVGGRWRLAGAAGGDLPELTIGAGGTGTVSFTIPRARLGGTDGLLGGDGTALVVHAIGDGHGDRSGDRIACGVLVGG